MGPAVTILLLLMAFIISATIVAVFPDLVNVDEPDGAQEVDIGANTDADADESRTADSSSMTLGLQKKALQEAGNDEFKGVVS